MDEFILKCLQTYAQKLRDEISTKDSWEKNELDTRIIESLNNFICAEYQKLKKEEKEKGNG